MAASPWDDMWTSALSWWNSTPRVSFLVSYPSVPPGPNFSKQISIVGSCDGATMLKIVSQYSSLSIPEYSRHNLVSRRNNAKLSGRWRRGVFPGHAGTLLSGSKWWSQVSSAVTNRETKLSEFSLNRRINALILSGYWMSNNICGTEGAETFSSTNSPARSNVLYR